MRTGIIYISSNKINGRIYIGQTWQGIDVRKSQHETTKSCRALSSAIKKYGKDSFLWSILFDGIETQEELDYAEDWAIWQYRSMAPHGYNLRAGGNGGLSEETKNRMIENAKRPEWIEHQRIIGIRCAANESWREKNTNAMREKALDKSWRNKQSEIGKALHQDEKYRENFKIAMQKRSNSYDWSKKMKERSATEEWKIKNGEAAKKKMRPVLCVELGIEYKSVKDAAKATGAHGGNIAAACNGRIKTTAGYSWKYIDNKS